MPQLAVGDKAPDFTLTDDNGASVKLSKLRGKQVIVYILPGSDDAGLHQAGLRLHRLARRAAGARL